LHRNDLKWTFRDHRHGSDDLLKYSVAVGFDVPHNTL